MKKNVFYSVVAMFMMLFVASCSQDEIVSVGQPGDGVVRISAKIPGATPNTRADMTVEGYKLHCVMEMLDASGTSLGQITAEDGDINAAEGTVNFQFDRNEIDGEIAKYLFWVDYVSATDAKGFYKTGNLQAVEYDGNKKAALFNNPAVDAFCGAVDATADNQINVTLTRPLSRIAIKVEDLAELGLDSYTKIIPNINGATQYDVNGKSTSAAMTLGLPEGETIDVVKEGTFAFYAYIFTGTVIAKATTITFSNDDGTAQKQVKLTAEQVKSLQANVSVNLVPEEDEPVEPVEDIVTVSIQIDNSFGEKDETPSVGDEETVAPAMRVGSYVNANGEVVTDAGEAVAIVFDMAADDAIDNYGEDFTGKTVKAWAVAIGEAVQNTWISSGATLAVIEGVENLSSMTGAENNILGYANTKAIEANGATAITGATFPALEVCTGWTPALTGSNTSGWYMPAIGQVKRLCDAMANEAFTTALGENTIEGVILSSTIYTNASGTNPMGIQFTSTDSNYGTIRTQRADGAYGALPIMTIFAE